MRRALTVLRVLWLVPSAAVGLARYAWFLGQITLDRAERRQGRR